MVPADIFDLVVDYGFDLLGQSQEFFFGVDKVVFDSQGLESDIIRVQVRDTGLGISSENKDKVFKKNLV